MMSIWRLVLQQVTMYKKWFLLLCVGLIFNLFAQYALMILFGQIIDKAIIPRQSTVLIHLLLLMIAVGVVDFVLCAGADYAKSMLRSRIVVDMRRRLFGFLQPQSPDFYAEFDHGRILSRFNQDIPKLEEAVIRVFSTGIGFGCSVLLGLIVLFYIDWRLALMSMAGFVLLFIPSIVLRPKVEMASRDYVREIERNNNILNEQLRGHAFIMTFGLAAYLSRKFERPLMGMLTSGFRNHYASYSIYRLTGSMLSLVTAVIVGYGGYLTFHDSMTAGEFVVFFTVAVKIGEAIFVLSSSVPKILEARVASERIGEITSRKPAVTEEGESIFLGPLASSIQMKDVSFAYRPELPVIRQVSLDIPARWNTAIVGTSGAGKSTLLHLLLRLYEPAAGTIAYDRCELRNIIRSSLQEQTAVVFQNTVLFDASIMDNIRAGRLEASDEEVVDAARAAGVHETITCMPDGYHTPVINLGESLSGGQRQRVALARALLHRPSVLFLDEATSALDPETEAAVNATIRGLSKKMAVVFVTHRLYSVRGADQIIVLQDGQVVEVGDHQQLMLARGRYRQLWDKQNGFIVTSSGAISKIKPELLAQMPIFQDVDMAVLTQLADRFVVEQHDADQSFIREGDVGNQFYVIARGKVSITKEINGAKKPLAILEDGDHVGEIALFKRIPRTATVTTMTPTVLLSLSRSEFHQLIDEYPEVRSYMEETVTRRMA